MRFLLHELANVFTGILVKGGLLHQELDGDLRQRFVAEICSGGERGAVLVHDARAWLIERAQRQRGRAAGPPGAKA